MVKSQLADIIDLILQLIGYPNGVHRPCRNRKSRGAVLSTSEGQWATTKFNHGKPPALPGDSQSLTVPGVCRSSSSRFWVLTLRLRSGPFEGPAIVKPPALPEDTYFLEEMGPSHLGCLFSGSSVTGISDSQYRGLTRACRKTPVRATG